MEQVGHPSGVVLVEPSPDFLPICARTEDVERGLDGLRLWIHRHILQLFPEGLQMPVPLFRGLLGLGKR